jgi:hypothetical protein
MGNNLCDEFWDLEDFCGPAHGTLYGGASSLMPGRRVVQLLLPAFLPRSLCRLVCLFSSLSFGWWWFSLLSLENLLSMSVSDESAKGWKFTQ